MWESFQKHIIFSYLNSLEFQNADIVGPVTPIYLLYLILGILPQKDFQFSSFLEEFFMEYFLTTRYSDQMRNHKQIPMNSK